MQLREYQRRSIDDLYSWFSEHDYGHPVVVLPTGAGKSVVIATFIKEAIQSWPETKILMLTHQAELIKQNSDKIRTIWPNAPMGVYSAGLNSRDLDQITVAGVQSLRNKADQIGRVDICIIDECHLINNRSEGGYRKLISDLEAINPSMRVVGYTATEYRMGQGLLTDGEERLFTDIIKPVTIMELIERGFLSPLRSKKTDSVIDMSRVKKRGGEYISKDLAIASDQITEAAIQEIIARAEGRRHWLLFCSGVEHSQHCADVLNEYGITAECLHGGHTKAQREDKLRRFTQGEIQALTNCDILTTGFDFPDIDLVAMLRPTLSPALYVQMAGRGMRLKSHTDHCLVLDFAGNVSEHGPITEVRPPKSRGSGGEAPTKSCPNCEELLYASAKICTCCGFEFPQDIAPKPYALDNADIMGLTDSEMDVTEWKWSKHKSYKTGREMVKVKYYGGLADPVVTEYLCINHEGRVGQRALSSLGLMATRSGVNGTIPDDPDMKLVADWMNTGKPPALISYKKNGKFYEVRDRKWQ